MLRQLAKLRVLKDPKIQMKSEFFNRVFEMYNNMGDSISVQYGGSIAHHSSMGKKKKIGEMIVGIKRHFNNVVTDPSKQRMFNLFLGVYVPTENVTPIWNLNDDAELHPNIANQRILRMPQVEGDRWWVNFIQEFEQWLPSKLQKNLTHDFMRNPDSDSEEENRIVDFIEHTQKLFKQEENYINKNGIFCLDGDSKKFHPFLFNLVQKAQNKTEEAQQKFIRNLYTLRGS